LQLKVYDVLGSEIVTLVNKELLAGNYEVEFSATSGFAFGGTTADKFFSLNFTPPLVGLRKKGIEEVKAKNKKYGLDA